MAELEGKTDETEMTGQMSFLEHLDELRRRLINSVLMIVVAFAVAFYFSVPIYNFLAVPVLRALAEAQRLEIPAEGIQGDEKILSLATLKDGDSGRYVFDRNTVIQGAKVLAGTSVSSVVTADRGGKLGLFTAEPIYTSRAVIPKGIRIPVNVGEPDLNPENPDARMIVTTAQEAFTLYVTVSLYTAIAASVPFLLLQIWGFIAPALYKHERRYVTPFIFLSTISFVLGAASAYYIIFPPAVQYLLGVGSEFSLMLRATDYFDLITLIMLAMGIIFQMPAVTYVLARIGLVTAGLLARSWKIALVVILIAAAVISPTGDIPNMMLFATPMMLLYAISIFIAWMFAKKRTTDPL
jgi:sec-independent protein translocase protein TatC